MRDARLRRGGPAWSAEYKHKQRSEAALAERPKDAVSQTDIDESLEETFPASDPTSWTLTRVGAPRRANDN